MDLLRPYEKTDSNYFNEHNLFNAPDTGQYHLPKIENTEWSATNEHLRMSSTSGNYDTIKDERNEETAPTNTDNAETDNTKNDQIESLANSYMSFTNWTPKRENNERTPGYSYATNVEIRFSPLDDSDGRHELTTLSSNVGNFSEQSPHLKYRLYDNASPKQTAQLTLNHSEVDSYSGDPRPVQHPSNYNSRTSDQKLGLRDTGNSDYCLGRVGPERSVQLPSSKTDKGKFSKCKIITCVLMVLLVVVAATVVVVIFIVNKSKAEECGDKNECWTNCQKYTDIANGHTNVTKEVSPYTAVQVICNTGFHVEGKDTAVCLKTGSWSRGITCVLVDCGKYEPPNNVRIPDNGHNTTFGTIVNVSCALGYQLSKTSDSYITCDENGEWVGSPKCENLVSLSIETDVIVFGGSLSLSCEFKKVPRWRIIYFKSINKNNESAVPISSVKNNVDSYPVTIDNSNIVILEKSFTHESGKVRLMFETVHCADAFEEPGDIKIECGVEFGGAGNTYRDEKIVRIQGKAVHPELYLSPHVIEGEDMSSVLFHCEMLFPEPNGHVIIETDFNGTFSTLLSSLNGEYGTDYAWIEDIKNKMTDCWYRMVVTFGLKNVSMKWHRKRIRCTAKPSEDAVDQTVYISDSKAVKVLQDNVCSGKVLVPYPYDCGYFIECDSNDNYQSILEVRSCDKNQCFDEQISSCSTCSSSSGCPIIDIYLYDGGSRVIGEQLDLICVVEDFKGLTNIKITRANGEFVSSIGVGDGIPGVNTIPDLTYLNGTNGQLSLHFEYLVCTDKSTYRCLPEGTETSSRRDDVTDINLNCS